MPTFEYRPRDGHRSRGHNPLVGYVEHGETYTVDRNVAEVLRRDQDFRELKPAAVRPKHRS